MREQKSAELAPVLQTVRALLDSKPLIDEGTKTTSDCRPFIRRS